MRSDGDLRVAQVGGVNRTSSDYFSKVHMFPGRLQSMAFVCWLLGHVLLAGNQRTSVHPVLLAKGLLVNRAFLAWGASVLVLALLVGCISELDTAIALVVLEPRDWGVALGTCLAGTCWIELVKFALLARRHVLLLQ